MRPKSRSRSSGGKKALNVLLVSDEPPRPYANMSTAARIENKDLLAVLADVRDRFDLINSIIIYAGSQVIYRCPPR